MNIIIQSSKWEYADIKTIFNDEQVIFLDAVDIPELLVKLGAYKSKSAARRAGRDGEIPKGYTEYKASKKHMLYIWNPERFLHEYTEGVGKLYYWLRMKLYRLFK